MTLQAVPYLIMDGNAKDAIEFYSQALDAEILEMITYKEMPEDFPENLQELVAHGRIQVGESNLMFSDSPGLPVHKGNQVTICILSKGVNKSKQIFEALQEGGQVNAPFEETSFSSAFGNVTDKFGITFQILTENPN